MGYDLFLSLCMYKKCIYCYAVSIIRLWRRMHLNFENYRLYQQSGHNFEAHLWNQKCLNFQNHGSCGDLNRTMPSDDSFFQKCQGIFVFTSIRPLSFFSYEENGSGALLARFGKKKNQFQINSWRNKPLKTKSLSEFEFLFPFKNLDFIRYHYSVLGSVLTLAKAEGLFCFQT